MRYFNVRFKSYEGKVRTESTSCQTFAEAARFAYEVKNQNKDFIKYIVSIVEEEKK